MLRALCTWLGTVPFVPFLRLLYKVASIKSREQITPPVDNVECIYVVITVVLWIDLSIGRAQRLTVLLE